MSVRRERVAPKESTPPKIRVVIPEQGEAQVVRIALNEPRAKKPEVVIDLEYPPTEPGATSS